LGRDTGGEEVHGGELGMDDRKGEASSNVQGLLKRIANITGCGSLALIH
jgi:hypothetical protein